MLNNPPQKSCLNKVKIHHQQLSNHNQVEYYYCMGTEKIKNIIVLVHGISRNASEIISSFSQVMDSNSILIAPVFSKEYATDYQRLGRRNKGPRADYILQAIVNELKNQYNITCNKLNLFGFSAGAQFAHRYTFAHPQTVNKVAIVAAGWYTLPSENIAYPIGLKLTDEFVDIDFELLRLLRAKFRVYVGAKDYLRDKALNKNKQVDTLQGQNRIERAKNWVKDMHKQCLKYQINNKIELVILPNVAHDFQDADNLVQLSSKVSSWFLESNK